MNQRPNAESDADLLRHAAKAMREQHGPQHERHMMWAAMADLLEAPLEWWFTTDDEYLYEAQFLEPFLVLARAYTTVTPPVRGTGG